jgi:hypothetical protein
MHGVPLIIEGWNPRSLAPKQFNGNHYLEIPPSLLPFMVVILLVQSTVSMETKGDTGCDQVINPNLMNQYIVWANGGLGETAFIHFTRSDRECH